MAAVERDPAPDPGIYPGVPFDAYKAWPAINWHLLLEALWSPQMFRKVQRDGKPEDPDKLLLNRLFHSYLLEPAQAARQYVVAPQVWPTLKAAKDGVSVRQPEDDKTGRVFKVSEGRKKDRPIWRAELVLDEETLRWRVDGDVPEGYTKLVMHEWKKGGTSNFRKDWERRVADAGQTVITAPEAAQARGMADSLLEMPVVQGLLDGAATEVSIVWVDPMTSLLCKARLDAVSKQGEIADAKSSRRKVDKVTFAEEMRKWNYPAQLAMQREGLNRALEATGKPVPEPALNNVHILTVETRADYAAAVYSMSACESCAISYPWYVCGAKMWHTLLCEINHCMSEDEWLGYTPDPTDSYPLPVPEWFDLEVRLRR